MKRLNKGQLQARDELVKRLNDAKGHVSEAVNAVNERIGEYNAAVADVETFRDEIAGEMETYYDERSDNWRDGDAGSNYDDWKNEWSNLDVTTIDEIDEPDMSLADDLEALPDEVSS